jgi:hypothetical protein
MSEPNVTASFADLTHDIIELGELQAQLLMCDVKKTTREARTSLVLFAIGLGLLLGCVPIVLIALAELLIWQFEWLPPVAYAVAAIVGLLGCAATLYTGYMKIKTGFETLGRSREELNRNIAWLKTTLKNRGKSNLEPSPVGRGQGEGSTTYRSPQY